MTVVRSGSATDVGRVRKVNQDLPLEATNLFAVADGMGGHVGGEVAARVAVETLEQSFNREPTTAGLREAFDEANQAVWQESQTNPDVRGMGTTLTAVALVGGADGRDTLALANVGDSRAYVLSGPNMVQITADHSLAEERMRHGEMTEEEAAVHPQRHILTRALGVSAEVEADMWELQLQAGDRVILCSDGLSNELGMEEMADALRAQSDPQAAAQSLVDLANDRGGSDNITVVVVDVLVGEEGLASSVVTPIGQRAGAPLVLGAAAGAATAVVTGLAFARSDEDPESAITSMVPAIPRTAVTEAVPTTDALAPGAQLGFRGPDTELSKSVPSSGQFFGGTATVPLARSSLRVPPKPSPPPPPEKESRSARRRRLGIPRRITVRVVVFMLMVAAVPVGAYFTIHWYAYDNWYVTLQGKQIVIKQGRPGGVLWFKSKIVDHTGVKTSQVLPTAVSALKGEGVQEPSLSKAKGYVAHAQYLYLYSYAKAVNNGGAGQLGPNGVIPKITAPPTTTSSTTTTTMPGQTTAPTTTTTTAPPVTTTTAAPTTTST
jgi:serine/threonine protein phosphatase PrpC